MYKHCILPVLLGATLNNLSIHAAEMEHVLVTTPIHKSDAQTALPISVINGDELRDKVASNLGETLANMPGLANASFGPSVGQPVIRGQQGARVTVLQNGTGSGDASNASADHAVSVEPVLAESIEVLRGPSTLLFGGGAIGGVVNVIDHRVPESAPEQLSGAFELRHGSVNDETTAVLKLEGGNEQFGFYLSGVSRDTNNIEIPGHAVAEPDEHEQENQGFIANSDSEMEAFTVGGSYFFDQGFIGLAVNRLKNEYGLPPGAHGQHEEEELEEEEGEEELDAIRLNIEQTRYDLRGAWLPHNSAEDHVIESIRLALTYSDYGHDEIEGNGEVGTHFSNETWEGRVELVHRAWAGLQGAVGFQFLASDFSAIGEEAFIPQTDISRYGLFIVEDFHHNDVVYEFGARLDRDSFNPDDIIGEESYSSLSLSASALWQLNEQWRFGAAISSSERAPVTEELFSNQFGQGLRVGDFIAHAASDGFIVHAASGVIEVGNPDLGTEQPNNLDLTFSYKTDGVDGFVTVYYNDFQDYIYLDNTNEFQDETPIYAYKQKNAKFIGIEFEVDFVLGSAFGGDFDLQVFGDLIDGELADSADVPRMPPTRIGTRLDYNRGGLNTYLSLIDAAKQDEPGDFEDETKGYTRWDAGVNYRFNEGAPQEYLVFAKLKNLSDEEIRGSVSFLRESAPEAGRSVELGVRMSF
jgi:iron complex outermembrane receptor protein